MPIEHDSREVMQRRALHNVRGLLDKLQYADALERRAEKPILFGIAALVVVVVLVLAMTIHAVVTAPGPEAEKQAMCETEARALSLQQFRRELARAQPEITTTEFRRRSDEHYRDTKSTARIACGGGYKHGH